MLVFLLKNGRLRLPVFLLVLIIGTELLPSAAPLQCYKCGGVKCKTDFKKPENIVTCEPDSNTGVNRISCSSHVTATTASRDCESLVFSKVCAEEVFKRSCITWQERSDKGFSTCRTWKTMKTGEKSVARSDDMNQASDSDTDKGSYCFCEGDLCNDEEEVVKIDVDSGTPSPNPTGPAGGDKNSDKGAATGGPFSSFNTFGVLFFAVLGAFVSAGSVMVCP